MKELVALHDAKSHSTSEGFAVSYLGARVRPVIPLSTGVVFNAGFGRRRMTYLCTQPARTMNVYGAVRVLSANPWEVPAGWTITKRKEYVLRSLSADHMTRKERYNEITHPVRTLGKQGYVLRRMTPADLPGVEALWREWCAMKLSDPKLHRISFTAARYLRCVRDALDDAYPSAAYVLASSDRIAAARILSTTATRAFDLAFFSDRDVKESARAMQWLSLQDLFANGITEVNFGESTGKGLSHFKTRLNTEVIDSFQHDALERSEAGLFDDTPSSIPAREDLAA